MVMQIQPFKSIQEIYLSDDCELFKKHVDEISKVKIDEDGDEYTTFNSASPIIIVVKNYEQLYDNYGQQVKIKVDVDEGNLYLKWSPCVDDISYALMLLVLQSDFYDKGL